MVRTLQSKNFSVGIAFYKTEALQAVIVGVIIFNQHVSLVTILAIILATIGVVMISNLKYLNSFFAFCLLSVPTPFPGLKQKAFVNGLSPTFSPIVIKGQV
jgi:EamA domain-containing membrane protein RarD